MTDHPFIEVHGAREKNLKNVSLSIPKQKITVFTGISGSGKSSLVFDTIAAEAQRQLNETFTFFVQGFMPHYGQPDVERIEHLNAPIIIDQKRAYSCRSLHAQRSISRPPHPFKTAVCPLTSAEVIVPVTYMTLVSKLPLPAVPRTALGASARHSNGPDPLRELKANFVSTGTKDGAPVPPDTSDSSGFGSSA